MRIVTGILALSPILLMVATIAVFPSELPATRAEAEAQFEVFHDLALAQIMWGWLVVLLFVILAWRSDAVPKEKRILWIALLFFGNILILPFFWYWYLQKPLSINADDS